MRAAAESASSRALRWPWPVQIQGRILIARFNLRRDQAHFVHARRVTDVNRSRYGLEGDVVVGFDEHDLLIPHLVDISQAALQAVPRGFVLIDLHRRLLAS